jgi:hypothetical protein
MPSKIPSKKSSQKKSALRVVETNAPANADRLPALTNDEQWLLRSYRALNPKMQGVSLRFLDNMTEKFGREKTTSLRLIQGGVK